MRSSRRFYRHLLEYASGQRHLVSKTSPVSRVCIKSCQHAESGYFRNISAFRQSITFYSTSNNPSEDKPPEGWSEEDDSPEGKRKREAERKERYRQKYTVNAALITKGYFEDINKKNKEAFLESIEMFTTRDKFLRGHVEFIQAALKHMKEFGVHKDLEAYKKLIDVFPKGKMVAQTIWQVEFMHYPKQQFCAIDILEQMEDNGVIGDGEVEDMLGNIFGYRSFPSRKHGRMMYWLPKFKHLSPWKLPDPLPNDGFELCKLAIQRITSVDLDTKITIYNAGDLVDALDQTWIISGQSQTQQSLIESHPSDRPIYVEGAFRVWLRDQCVNYFILRSEPLPKPKVIEQDPDDVSEIDTFITSSEEKQIVPAQSVHEQDDGVILACCATGTSSKDSLLSWIRFLQDTNPRLGKDISVIFTLKSPIGPTDNLDVLATDDVNNLKITGEGEDDKQRIGVGLGFDPKKPDLSQVGVWRLSDTRFVNWPHHFNRTQEYYQEEPVERVDGKDHPKLNVDSDVKSNDQPDKER